MGANRSHRWQAPLVPLALVVALGACQDATAPETIPSPPAFAAAKNALTVTSLDDPGDGVCTTSHCTLREAIAAAPPGAAIGFKNALKGTIMLTEGELLIESDLTIRGGGKITIDAQGASRVFRIGESATVEIDGFTIQGGLSGRGGGIVNEGRLTVANSVITGNRAVFTAIPEIGQGGGIASLGSLTVKHSVIEGNEAEASGGGISSSAGVQLTASLTIEASVIRMNQSGHPGGGVFTRGTAVITGTAIAANEAAESGGGVGMNFGWLAIVNSTISENSANDQGGGINALVSSDGSFSMRSSTVAFNTAGSAGGGIAVQFTETGSSITVGNSIIAGNAASQASECTTASIDRFVSLGHNLTTTGGGPCSFTAVGDVTVNGAQVTTEVVERELKANGGFAPTHALVERGWAIDAGYCPGVVTDQRGVARPFDDVRMPNAVEGCDIGAFEWTGLATTSGAGGKGKGKKP